MAASLALGLSWCIAKSPLTLYDGLGPILDARRSPGLDSTFYGALYSSGYWRPLRLTQIKAVVDASPADPVFAFKTIHVALVLAMFVLFAVNHFLEIVTLTVAVAALARGAPRWWKDGVATLLLVIGALTIESGLLIGVAAIACWLVGWRGISWRGVAAIVVVLAAYLWVRFVVLEIPSPGLDERATGWWLARLEPGWWLARLEPDEIVRRFGDNPLPFYVYNIITGFAGALLSEPRSGTFWFVGRVLKDDVRPWMLIQIASSVLVTSVMLAALLPALVRWRRRTLDDRDRFVLLAFGMLAANAALSFGYVKDEVLSVGVAFYAGGAFAVLAALGERAASRAAGAAALLVCTSVLWTTRAVDTFFSLERSAYNVANDWAVYSLAKELPRDWEYEPTRRLFLELQRRNVSREVPHPAFTKERYVDEYLELD
ncbi:MAG: hypothetical protein HYU37_01375 [Acidobacteria bacterium]|nr:hypothetical protein [Acidobacteriota bacterium]